MNEDVNQPKQDDTEVSNAFPNASGPLSSQDLMLSADSPYEETHVPIREVFRSVSLLSFSCKLTRSLKLSAKES
jgi:hypothetical protein